MPDALSYNRLFDSKVVSNSADNIFTLGSGVLRNLVILVTNSTASPVTLDGWVVPSEGSAAQANQFISDYSIAANSTAEIAVPKMVTGDTLTLQAGTANALTVFDHDSVVRV